MRYCLTAFRYSLLQQLRSLKTWILLLLLSLLIAVLPGLLPQQERAAPVQVGVALPEEGGEAFWDLLQERSGAVITFIPADAATVEARVATGQWDCGLLLPEDFDKKLQSLSTHRLITMTVSDASAAYPLVRETVAAYVISLIAPDIARDYLTESGIAPEDTLPQLESVLEQVLPESERLLVTMTTPDGAALDPLTLADAGLAGLLRGLIAVILLVWVLMSAVDAGRWLETPAAARLRPLLGAATLLLPRILAAAVPALLSAGIALCLLGSGNILPLLAYLAALCALALLAARIPAVWTALPPLMPFVPLLCLVLSPVLFDPASLFPALAPLSAAMPITLFLRACDGAWQAGLLLLGAGILLTAAAFLPDMKHR